MARYRHASIFLYSKKIGKCSGGTYRLTSATEAQFNDDGYAGESEAPFMLEITANTIEQVGSSGIDVMQIMLQRKQITLTYATLEGKIHESKLCRATQCETTWSGQNGTHTGSYTFRGPPPKLVG
jgi:hypothetical protein